MTGSRKSPEKIDWRNWRHWAMIPVWVVAVPVMVFFAFTGAGILVSIVIAVALITAHENIDDFTGPDPKMSFKRGGVKPLYPAPVKKAPKVDPMVFREMAFVDTGRSYSVSISAGRAAREA